MALMLSPRLQSWTASLTKHYFILQWNTYFILYIKKACHCLPRPLWSSQLNHGSLWLRQIVVGRKSIFHFLHRLHLCLYWPDTSRLKWWKSEKEESNSYVSPDCCKWPGMPPFTSPVCSAVKNHRSPLPHCQNIWWARGLGKRSEFLKRRQPQVFLLTSTFLNVH